MANLPEAIKRHQEQIKLKKANKKLKDKDKNANPVIDKDGKVLIKNNGQIYVNVNKKVEKK